MGSLLERAAAVHGSSVMVDQAAEPRTGVPARILTVAAAAELVDVWAGALVADGKLGVGDRVVVATPNSVEMLLATLAVSRAGGIPAPVNDAMRDDEIAHVVRDADASVVIRGVDELDALALRLGVNSGLGLSLGPGGMAFWPVICDRSMPASGNSVASDSTMPLPVAVPRCSWKRSIAA